jgi:Rad3-related DNA helicase
MRFNRPNFTQVQKDLMSSIVSTLQHKRIGIFESPTGTGKSLSILCSTISWLQDNALADPCDTAAGKTTPSLSLLAAAYH